MRRDVRHRKQATRTRDDHKVNLLFVCSRNHWRSPTAEAVGRDHPGVVVRSGHEREGTPQGVGRRPAQRPRCADVARGRPRSGGAPPIAQDRLELRDDGTVRYRFKRAGKDGSTAVDLHPFDLLARLCALSPPPRFNMVRYHGVLSAHAKLRAEVVPAPPEPEPDPLELQAQLPLCVEPEVVPRRKPWAWLLKHAQGAGCPRGREPGGRHRLPPLQGPHHLAAGRDRARRYRPGPGQAWARASSRSAAPREGGALEAAPLRLPPARWQFPPFPRPSSGPLCPSRRPGPPYIILHVEFA